MKDHPIAKSLEAAKSFMIGYEQCSENYERVYVSFSREVCKESGMSYLEFDKRWEEFKRKEMLVAWEYFQHKAKYLFQDKPI